MTMGVVLDFVTKRFGGAAAQNVDVAAKLDLWERRYGVRRTSTIRCLMLLC